MQHKIKSIKKLDIRNDRYDLTINTTHNFFANSILIHNTSARVGNVQIDKNLTFIERILIKLKFDIALTKWQYLIGSRRTILDITHPKGTGFYSDSFRQLAAKPFMNNLHKGETIFYEVVGYDSTTGSPIMGIPNTKKLKDKEFTKKYGELMPYSYGCEPGTFDIFVYRITITDEDGNSYDLNWDDVKIRCGQLGVKHTPELARGLKNTISGNPNISFVEFVEALACGPSTVDQRHIREGVCVRVDSNYEVLVLKHKSFEFKTLESALKDDGVADMEEVEDTTETN